MKHLVHRLLRSSTVDNGKELGFVIHNQHEQGELQKRHSGDTTEDTVKKAENLNSKGSAEAVLRHEEEGGAWLA